MFKTIVWGTDGSELADSALDLVRELARQDGSRIVAVHVNELLYNRLNSSLPLADEPDVEDRIARQVEALRSEGFDATLEVRSGARDVATLVAGAARDVDADLIVVATHGRGGLKTALMGSVARALCHTAARPLLVVPASERSETAREPLSGRADCDWLIAHPERGSFAGR